MTAGELAPRQVAFRDTALRFGVAGCGALLLAHAPGPRLVCPLRTLTGIPCPICGTTTAATRLGRFDIAGALAANPFTLIAAGLLVLAPVLLLRRPALRVPWPALAAVAAASWIWQLARFDLVPH